MKKINLFLFLIFICISCERNDMYKVSTELYKLRDIGPAGGLIFYINPNWKTDGWKYMEAAPFDQSSVQRWSNNLTAIGISAQGTAIGTGPSNTTAIINQAGHTDSAAQICRNYNGGGKSDWFLPSKDELNQMWLNLKKGDGYTPIGGFLNSLYLCSSEYDVNPLNSWLQDFSTGNVSDDTKSVASFITRAARRF